MLVGTGANDARGVVVEMEHRRKSGRSVGEWYFLPAASRDMRGGAGTATGAAEREKERERGRVMLLDDHPLYKTAVNTEEELPGASGTGNADEATTFNLGLTDKQRRDREGVVLPYFDAQKEGGGGGGRILYDMGVEDDFDEEEDEI